MPRCASAGREPPEVEVAQPGRQVRRDHVDVPSQEHEPEHDQHDAAREVDPTEPSPRFAEHHGHLSERQPAEEERHPEPERVRREEHDPTRGRTAGSRGQREHAPENRSDARRPGEGEGHPHDRRRPCTEHRGPHRDATLAGEREGKRSSGGHPHEHRAEEHDRDARRRLQCPLVGEEEAAERRGGRAEDHEDDGEPRDEGEDPAEEPRARHAGPEWVGTIRSGRNRRRAVGGLAGIPHLGWEAGPSRSR